MVSKDGVENVLTVIAELDRFELTRRIKKFKGRFELDFTDSYLKKQSLDRLRHILMAAILTSKRNN